MTSARRQLLADLALLVVALVWGSTFVMVKDAVSAFPVFAFLTIRFTFAALSLAPLVAIRTRQRAASDPAPWRSRLTPARTVGPALAGLALFAGYGFQTAGLQLTTPAKAGFITGLSVVIVPVIAALALRQRLPRAAWLGVALATAGLALLSLQRDLAVERGDLLVFFCALAFAAQILLTGILARRYDPLRFTLVEVVVVAVLSGAISLLFEEPSWPSLRVLGAALFTGVLATSAAFGIQTAAQRFTSSAHTALIFATEPVFAALFSFLLIGELLTARQIFGAALILAGMLVAEVRVPFRRKASPAGQA